jgi:hypothetical protein
MELLILFSLFPMIVWDFRCRRVLLWHLLLFGVLQLVLSTYRLGWAVVSQNLIINVLALSVIGIALWLYIRIRFGRKTVIGMGDIIFIFLLSPYFSCREFMYFLIISSLLTLIVWMICRYIHIEEKNNEIPLISAFGICYFILLIYQRLMTL